MNIHEFKPKDKYKDRVQGTDESYENINDVAADDDHVRSVTNIVDQLFHDADVLQAASFIDWT